MGKRIIFCGSRGWTDRALIEVAIDAMPSGSVVVCGYNTYANSPSGADRIAYEIGNAKPHVTVECFPAKWEKYGKAAGFIRNREMAEGGGDGCLAFWDGNSPGTADMIAQARRHDIPVKIVNPKEST